MPPMTADGEVFHDVLVLRRTDLGWLCRIDGVQLFLARLEVDPACMPPSASAVRSG